jgi:MFS family permease
MTPPEAVSLGTRFLTDIPSRLDRLPWSRWHARIVLALGITWTLDGLEVTLVGAVGNTLRSQSTLGLSESQIGASASAYLAGATVGALVFGRLTDALGRKRLFFATLGVYLLATLGTALSWSFASFAFFRAVTGAGIGGEYAAINSAIDELLPARVRGRADLAINSTYWLGTAIGAIGSVLLLRPNLLPESIRWRVCFGLGGVLGLGVFALRARVPESPRWLLLHGRIENAQNVVAAIEREVASKPPRALPAPAPPVTLVAERHATLAAIWHVLFRTHRRRTVLGLSLMIAQAFAYNGVFFTNALVLGRYCGVPASDVGYYLIPFAVTNLLGPLVLGHLFDTVGRRRMIAATYALSGVLVAAAGAWVAYGDLTAFSMTVGWCVAFFFASAAASSAYLTVSELFPVSLRGMAIAVFFAIGTGVGGVIAPALFGALIETGKRDALMLGYGIAALLLLAASAVGVRLGVTAEWKSLEELATVD